MYKRIVIGVSIAVLMATIGTAFWSVHRKQTGPFEKLSIGVIPSSYAAYSVYIALEEGYFKEQGLDVALQSYPHGKATLDAVIRRKADVATSSETPFMHSVLSGRKIYAFAVTATAEKHLAIITRKDRDILTADDLRGKTIGVTIGTNGEYFMDIVLLLNGISRDEIKTVNLKPTRMFDALINGEADAIVTWNPQMHKARRTLGDQGSTFYASGLYASLFVASARQDYTDANPKIIEKMVRSLVNASEFIRDHLDKSRKIAAQYLKSDPSLLDELSAVYDFKISLDQSFLLTLEDQSKWAIKNELTDSGTVPNYLNYIYTDALKAVEPESVTIIK